MVASLFYPSFPPPGTGNPSDQSLDGAGDGGEYVMGTGFEVLAAGTLTAIYYYVPSVTIPTTSDFAIGMFDVTSGSSGATAVTHELVTLPVVGDKNTWKRYPLTTPQSLLTGHRYRAAMRTNRYAYSKNVFDTAFGAPITNGNIRGFADNGPAGRPNGAFINGAPLDGGAFASPDSSFGATFYGIDVEIDFAAPEVYAGWGLPLS